MRRELARHKGVTLQLLWLEYREAHPDGYQYSRFCDRYREWRGRLDVVLRQVYRAGEKAFVDYAGSTIEEVGEAVGPLLEALNERPFQKAEGSRHSLFEDLDRPAASVSASGRGGGSVWVVGQAATGLAS